MVYHLPRMPWKSTYTIPVVIAGLVLLALAGVAFSRMAAVPVAEVASGTPTSTATTTAPVVRPKLKSKNVSRLEPKLTYDAAMDQYRDRRFQFDNCAVTPPRQTYKSGSRVMLDNRSPDGAEIRLDGAAHRLYGYEFKIITLTSAKLPHTVQVDCSTNDTPAYNVAQILLQR